MQLQGVTSSILPLHILAGMLALMFGYVALYAAKGATLHRKSGMLFVYAMVTLSLSGALMEALTKSLTSINVVAGLLTFYFVITALLTVRPRSQGIVMGGCRRRAAGVDGQCARIRGRFRAGESWQARGSSELHLWRRRLSGRSRRRSHVASGRYSRIASYQTALVAHVFRDVGCRRLLLLGSAKQSP